MKLSEMNTRQLAKALCDLTQPVANLCGDKSVMDALQVLQNVRNGISEGSLADVIAKVVPVLLDKHYDDFAAVLSALTGKTTEDIGKQSGMQTVTDILECVDGELLTFFTSSVPMGKMPSLQQSMPTAHRQASRPWPGIWQKTRKNRSGKRTLRK